jgi:hypothetical protein
MMQQGNPGGNLIKVRPRTTNTQISRGRTAFISDHNGEADRKHAIEGLYVYDTRVLSHYAWRIDGKQPVFSCGSPRTIQPDGIFDPGS